MKEVNRFAWWVCAILAVLLIMTVGPEVIDAIYDAGYGDGLSAQAEVPKPESGEILEGKEYSDSEITVHASYTKDCVVSLKSSSGKTYVSFYVRAGDSVTVGVPDKRLYVYFASGKDWYGYGEGLMFGEDTVYTKDDDKINFAKYTSEYTLYKVEDGDFSPSSSDENEFFE